MRRPRLDRTAALLALAIGSYAVFCWTAIVAAAVSSSACDWIGGRSPGSIWPSSAAGFLEFVFMPAWGPVRLALDGNWVMVLVLGIVFAHALATACLAAPTLAAPRPSAGSAGRSLRLSVAGAAVVGATLAISGIALVADLVMLAQGSKGGSASWLHDHWFPLLAAWTAIGVIWAWLLGRAGAARSPMGIDRWVRWLLAGTAIEATIAAPTLAAAARRDSCYCTWSSWWILAGGSGLLAMMCGPAVILLWSRERRRNWMRGACLACGYPRHGSGAACPECGLEHGAGSGEAPAQP